MLIRQGTGRWWVAGCLAWLVMGQGVFAGGSGKKSPLALTFDDWEEIEVELVANGNAGGESWDEVYEGEYSYAGASKGGFLNLVTVGTVTGQSRTDNESDQVIRFSIDADFESTIWWYGGVGFWFGTLPSADLSKVRLRVDIKGLRLPENPESHHGDYVIRIVSPGEGGKNNIFYAGVANGQWQTLDIPLSEMTDSDPANHPFDPRSNDLKLQIEFFEAIGSWRAGGTLLIDNLLLSSTVDRPPGSIPGDAQRGH